MQKTAVFIIIATLLSLLLLGCRQEEGVGTVTAVTVATTPPTVTSSPTVVVTETAVPTATQTPEPTPTVVERTPLPTRPASLPTVAFQANVDYKLVQPPPDALLNVMQRVGEFDDIHVDTDALNRTPPYRQVSDVVKADMDNFYPSHFPNATELLKDLSLTSYYFGWWGPSSFHYRLLEDGIVQYLNENKIQLNTDEVIETDAFDLHAFSINLDDDDISEWVIQVKASAFRTTTHFLLREEPLNNYTLLSSQLPNYVGRHNSDGFTFVNTDHDLTGDGINEIIIHNDTYMGGNGNDITLRIFSWSEGGLTPFPVIDMPYNSLVEDRPLHEVVDVNNDGVKDIQITWGQSGNFGCYSESVYGYIWQDSDWQEIQLSITDTPECNLWRSGSSNNSVDEDIELLEKALKEWQPQSAADFDLIGLARLRLALAYFVKGEIPAAQRILDSLSDLPEESKFTQLVREAYNDADKEPLQTCRNLLDVADKTLLTDIGNFIINYQAIQGWVESGYGDLPNRSTICNIAKIAEQIIANTDFPASVSPPDVLAQKGVHYDFATAVNLDADPELEWIGVLESQIGKITTFDLGEEGWTYDIDHWYTLAKNYEVSEQDVTGDGKEDVIVLVTEEDYCFEVEKMTLRQSTQLLFSEDESARFSGSIFPCDSEELLTLEDVGANDFSSYPFNSQPEWKTLENYPQTDLSLYEYDQELQTAVLTQTDPDITSKITDLLNYLPSDDPETRPYREHLTYLLGYHYELIGEEEEAVNTYLNLIQQNPSSPWSWLAWARLQPE